MTPFELDRSRLYGLTHTLSGKPVTRQVRMLKVGFGYPKGPAIHTWINLKGRWVVQIGFGKETASKEFETRDEARAFYMEQRKRAPERKAPGKFPYFTFHRIGMDGDYWPDWDAIEQHGPIPTEIEIVFLTNNPLEQTFQWWTAAELKCEGNGRDARRRNEMAKTEQEKAAAKQAADAGEKFFPILEGCYARGCPYARGDKPVCKPHSRLSFQLASAPMLGGTCTFDTTGFRSGANLFSCLEQIRVITGRGNPDQGVVAGIPLLLVLRPYKTSHNGVPATQYGVSLQLRAEDAVRLCQKAIAHGDEFRAVLQAPPLQIEAPSEPETQQEDAGERELADQVEGKIMTAEFYPSEEAEPAEDWDDPGQQEPRKEPKRKSERAAEGEQATLLPDEEPKE